MFPSNVEFKFRNILTNIAPVHILISGYTSCGSGLLLSCSEYYFSESTWFFPFCISFDTKLTDAGKLENYKKTCQFRVLVENEVIIRSFSCHALRWPSPTTAVRSNGPQLKYYVTLPNELEHHREVYDAPFNFCLPKRSVIIVIVGVVLRICNCAGFLSLKR